MRTVRNITVAVTPELYHQTRKIAAEYNTSVTDMVRFLLLALPEAVKAALYPGGRPQFGRAVYLKARAAARAAAPAPGGAGAPPKNRKFALYSSKPHSTPCSFSNLRSHTSRPHRRSKSVGLN
jgi:hypothetical protein